MRPLVLLAALLAVPACAPADDAPSVEAGVAPPVPAPPDATPLAERLPMELDGRPRQSLDVSVDGALGAEVTRVEADYGEITLAVSDFGTAEMTEMMGHGWGLTAGAETFQGYPVQRDSAGRSYTVRVRVGGHHMAEATAGTRRDAEAALTSLDLAGLARDE